MTTQYSSKYPEVQPIVSSRWGEMRMDLTDFPKWKIPDKVVIKVAPTGNLFERNLNPYLPYSTKEIREAAISCIDAGACSIHVHVRDENGKITADRKYFREVIDPLKAKYGNKVLFDGETAYGANFEDAMVPITEGLLEASAVNCTATYIGNWGTIIPVSFIQRQARVIEEHNCKPQIAMYNLGDVDNAYRFLIKPGIIRQPYEWIICPALPGCYPMPNVRAMCEGLLMFINRIREIDPSDNPFICVTSPGRSSSYLTTLAILLGLHVRIGMEDTMWKYPHKDDVAKSNKETVESTVEIARRLGREPATADEYRKLVGLKK